MKQTEREILSSINEVLGTGLKESSYQYARFDAKFKEALQVVIEN